MDAAFRVEVETLASILDHLDYFQILELEPGATYREIKVAYHRKSRIFHPDRFLGHGDREFTAKVLAIHKRITEAYTVLRDEQSRRQYQERISGPERERHLRWTLQQEEESPAAEEVVGTTEKGRKLYGAALAELAAGRLDAAERNLKMALVFEPNNPHYARKAEEVARLRKASLQEGSLSST
ncbi:MAG: J domain-containing protein [Pseudomonadota bacterium]